MKFLTTIFSKILLLMILFLTSCLQEPAKVINRSNTNYNKNNKFNQEKYRNLVQKNSSKTNKLSDSNSKKENSSEQINNSNNDQIVVKQGETLYSIAKNNGVALREIIEQNNLQPPYQIKTGDIIKIPQSNYHESRDGDTLYSVSRLYNMKVDDLIALNNLKFPYSIYPGDKLKIIQKSDSTIPNSNPKLAKNSNANKGNFTPQGQSQNLADSESSIKSKSGFKTSEEKVKEITLKSGTNLPNNNAKISRGFKPSEVKAQELASDYKNTNDSNQNVKNIINPSKNEIVETKLTINKPIDKNAIKKIANKNNEFCWPVKGQVISRFGPKSAGMFNDGINIKAREGQSVIASEDGIVAYVGNELKGYGNLVIIKHAGGWISAYAHLKNYAVELGQKINKGQKIGLVGNSGKVKSSQLYFGLRKGREAVNPEHYLKS